MELTGLSFLFTCQPTKSSNFSRSDVNVRAHILRKNYSRNFSSIRSTPEIYNAYTVCGYSAEEIPGYYVNTAVIFYSCERTRAYFMINLL